MGGNFLDSKWMRILNILADFVLLSILWSICSLPIVTVGWATAAMYHTMQKTVLQERGRLFSSFLTSLKQSAKYALPAGILMTVMTAAVAFFIYFVLESHSETLAVALTMAAVLFALLLISQIYLYPLIGHFELNVSQLCFLTVQLMVRHPIKSAMLLALWVFSVSVVEYYPPLIGFVPAGYMFVASNIFTPLFYKYIRIADNNNENPGKNDGLPFEEESPW